MPIPWVAPFLELGLGGSLGTFSTQDGQAVAETAKGLTYHVPVGLGLALGRRREFELAFQYLFHDAQKQFSGAVALGIQFPLD